MTHQLITFATPNFYVSKRTLLNSAKRFGIAQAKGFNHKEFKKTAFYKEQISITSQARGAGYWLWKPYYILQELQKLQEDELLIYCDSGVDIVENLTPLYEIAKNSAQGVVLFKNYQAAAYFPKTTNLDYSEYNINVEVNKNKYWAKRDVFVLMQLDEERYWNSPQVDANFQIYRKCNESIIFVTEWLNYCCNEQIITDSPNKSGKPNFENMFAHIHDQAIISLLAEKYSIPLFRCPSQYGNHLKKSIYRKKGEFLLLPYSHNLLENSNYGTLLNHHRTKNMPFIHRWKSFLKQEMNVLRGYVSAYFC